MADIDGILERLVTDQRFRAELGSDPAAALAGYDLDADDLALLASSMDEGDAGQRGVEQRTSKSAIVGLLASLTGGGGGGGKPQAADVFNKTRGTDAGNVLAPAGAGDPSHAAVDMFAPPGGGNAPSGRYAPPGGGNAPGAELFNKVHGAAGNLIAPPDGGSAQASDIFAKTGGDAQAADIFAKTGGGESKAAVDMFAPADISGNAPADVNGDTAAIGDIKGVGSSGPSMDAPDLKIGPADDASPDKVLGNLAPAAATGTPDGYPTGGGFTSAPAGAQAPSVSETGGEGTKGILIGLNQGDAAVNGDGSPAELIGLLQPPTGEGAKGIDVHSIKMGEAVDAFLEIDDA